MKNIKIITFIVTLAFSSITYAGWLDFFSQSEEAVDDTATTANTVNNTVQGAETAVQSSSSSLVDTLVNQLGVTSAQAQGGSGALFQVAKSKMTESAFSQLSQSIPGMGGMLSAVPKATSSTSGSGSLLGGLAAASGNSTLATAASLVNTFQKLDMSKGMVSQFTPIVIDYVKKNSGELTGNLLQTALGGL